MDVNCTWGKSCNHTSRYVDGNSGNSKPQLISDELKLQLEIYIHISSFAITALLGITTNVINIIVYWKQGLKDSITVGFFALSFSDLILAMMTFGVASCYAGKVFSWDSDIDFSSVLYVTFAGLQKFSYSSSCVMTLYLAMERCCCVVMPFKVKVIFTRTRTVAILVSVGLFHIACYTAYAACQPLKWLPQYSENGTVTYRLEVQFAAFRDEIVHIMITVVGIFIPTASQAVVTVCVVVLIKGLRESSKFRKGVTSTNFPDQVLVDIKEKSNGKLESRDARLVKTMILLVIIMSSCNIPLLMLTYAQRIVPDLDIGGAYVNTFSLCFSIVYVLTTLGASVNIFVYYRNSTRYREILNSLFCLKKKSKDN